jgi:signal transduction histidine kinase
MPPAGEPRAPMVERVTAGDALYRVIRTLTERRPLDEILTEILSQTRAMLDASETYLLLKTDQQLRVRAADGLQIGPAGRTAFSIDDGIEGVVARSGEPVAASDLRQDPRFADPFDRPQPVGSMLAVPLVLGGRLLGVLVSTRPGPSRFVGVNTWWLEVFGGLIVSLIASDQSYRVQQRRASQAEALLELGTRDEDPSASPPALAAVARALAAERCGVLLRDDHGAGFVHHCFDTRSVDLATPATLAPAELGSLAEVLQSGRALSVPDVQQAPGLAEVPCLTRVHSLIAAPIYVGGEARGILYVGWPDPSWMDGDEGFLDLAAGRFGLILERRELQQRQREFERQQAQMTARQEFLGIVSHELKTPVAVMKAYTELLLRRAERAGRSSELDLLHRMDDQAERMLAMIEQLLDLRRMEAGLLTLEISHFDLIEVVRRLAHDLELAAASDVGAPRIRVEAEGRLSIRADRRRVEEVITNLLDNAVKFSPPDGVVQVQVSRERGESGEEWARIAVHDQGPGVAQPDAERVFERFYQASGRLHKGHAGLGLGLYISRELVRRHGGEVWLASEPGQGATFLVRLPVAGPPTPE